MCKVVSVAAAVMAAAALWVTPALADGPGVGTPTVVSVGDSAISGEAGRWAGNTNGQLGERRRARLDRVLRQRRHAARRSPAVTARSRPRSHIGGGVTERQPRLLGRATYTQHSAPAATSSRASTSTTTAPGTRARRWRCSSFAATHNVKTVIAADRRQQLRLRRHRADVRHRLADLAVVVEELLQRRLEHDREASPPRTSPPRPTNVKNALLQRPHGDGERRLRRRSQYTIIVQTYSSPIPHGAGFRYSADRLHAPDDRRLRRLEPRRRLGQRHGRRRRSTTRCATRAAQRA